MFLIPRRQIWTQQPQGPVKINAAHPAASGLTVWLSTNPHQLVGAQELSAVSETGESSLIGQKGVARQWSRTAGAGIDFGTNQLITGRAVTVLVIAAPANVAQMKAAFSQRFEGGSYAQTDFIFNAYNDGLSAYAGNVQLLTYTGSSSGVIAQAQTDGLPHCWVASNSADFGYIFRDGVNQALTQDVRIFADIYNTSQELAIGRMGAQVGSTAYQHDDPLYMVAVWNRQLSIRWAQELSASPWQILKRQDSRIFVPVSAGGGTTAYTLDSQPGSIAVVGSSATLKTSRKLSANAGSVAIVGASATLKVARKLAASAGTASVVGFAATCKVSRKLNAAAGAITIAGASAELVYTAVGASPVLNAEPGSVAIVGAPATLKATRKLASDAGSIVITGAVAGLSAGRKINAGLGAYSISGNDATLVWHQLAPSLNASPGSVVITGYAATLTKNGAVTLTQADIEAIVSAVLAALNATTIPVDVQKMNTFAVIGEGSTAEPWRGFGVSP